MLVRYETYSDFLAVAKEATSCSWSMSNDWMDYLTYEQALSKAHYGDDSRVELASQYIDAIEDVTEGDAIRQWVPSPYGAYPVVPEFLAGSPLCMRMLGDSPELAPVNIYCSTTIAAGIGRDELMRRGAAILALVLKLQKSRSVNLYLTAETHGVTDGDLIQVIPIESRPLSIAHACFGLTSAGFARHLTYSIARQKDNFNGGWGRYSNPMNGGSFAYMTRVLELTPHDLYIKPAHVADALINDPVRWVNEQLRKYNEN